MRKKFSAILTSEVRLLWDAKKEKHARRKDNLEAKLKPGKEESSFKGITISDEELGIDVDGEINVAAYGVEVNEDEKTFLKLPKSATDFTRINVESFKTNIQVMAAKNESERS